MRVGTMLSMPGDNAGVRELVQRAVDAEKAGFRSAWLPQVSTVDALTVLALAGGETSAIELGTAVVPTYPRHPSALATQALSVQDATGNRLALGIGLSHKFMIEGILGLDYSRPIPHMRDYLTILNAALAGEPVRHEGEEFRVNNFQLTAPGTKAPPVLVAALGPAMLRLCGRLSDGTVTWMGGVEYLRDVAVPAMSGAAAKAERPSPRFVAMVPVLLADDDTAGRETITRSFSMYGNIPSYRATLDRGGAANPGDVAVVGNEASIRAGLQAYEAAGVTDFVVVVPKGSPSEQATKELVAGLASQWG